VIKIQGVLITYTPFNAKSRVLFHHTLFGRILYRRYKKKQYAYYLQGMLDKKPFLRVMDSKIFLEDTAGIDFDILKSFADIDVKECERDVRKESMTTAEEHWEMIVKERGLPLKKRRMKIKDGIQ